MSSTDLSPLAITISRQLGCGAAYIGQHLATRLCILYLDREILRQAAERLHASENDLQSREESVATFWQSWGQAVVCSPDVMYIPPVLNVPTNREVYRVESNIIQQIAQQQSVVIVGRGGVHVLSAVPRHLSIFLYGHREFRQQRVEEIYHLPPKEARGAIEASDHTRSHFHHLLTGKDWDDARQYHLCLDTSALGILETIDVILAYIHHRFTISLPDGQ